LHVIVRKKIRGLPQGQTNVNLVGSKHTGNSCSAGDLELQDSEEGEIKHLGGPTLRARCKNWREKKTSGGGVGGKADTFRAGGNILRGHTTCTPGAGLSLA